MDRDEHLAWCKRRALECLSAGKIGDAVASMASDLAKHDAWRESPIMPTLTMLGMTYILNHDAEGCRRWIEGFN